MEIGSACPKNLRGVLFDLDGTLADSLSHLFRAYIRFLALHGQQGSREEFDRLNGPTIWEVLQRLNMKYSLELSEEEMRAEYTQLMQEEMRDVPDLFPGAAECIQFLRNREIPLAIVTSASRTFVVAFLKEHRLLGAFEEIVAAEDILLGKPAPEIYLKALVQMGISAEEALAIEDSWNGVASATGAGISTWWIFAHRYEHLPEHKRILPISDWKEALHLLQRAYGKV